MFCEQRDIGTQSVFVHCVIDEMKGSFTILLAEDEVVVRNLLHRILTKHGYEVMAGANGYEALSLAQAYQGRIHLLVTDIQMPEMNGFDLVDVMRAERPETAILMMSGRYSDDLGQLDKETPFLRKPFLPKILLERVQYLLDQQSSRG